MLPALHEESAGVGMNRIFDRKPYLPEFIFAAFVIGGLFALGCSQ